MNDAFGIPDSPATRDATAPAEPRWATMDERQDARRSMIPELYKTTLERMACELALKMDDTEAVFARYGYGPEDAAALMEAPAFSGMLERIGVEIRENGLSFRSKAKAISEELLPYAFDLATDPMTSAAVRADLIKWAAKVAGNEPAPPKSEGIAGGGGFMLSITFAGQAPQQIVAGREPMTLEHSEG